MYCPQIDMCMSITKGVDYTVLHGGRYTLIFSKDLNITAKRCCHTFICLPLPYMEGIVLICNTDLYCVIAIFKGHW